MGKIDKIYEKVLIVEDKPEFLAVAKEVYSNATFVDNLKEAMENLQKGHSYDAVISTLYFNGSKNPEGVDIGKRCLEKNIPFAILASENKQKIRKTRAKFYKDKELVNLVGEEDPLFYMISNVNFEINKLDPNAWEGAYKWINTMK